MKTHLRLHCPGLDGQDCPTRAWITVDLSNVAFSGLTGPRLHILLKRAGWALGALHGPDGPCFDALCPTCGGALVERLRSATTDPAMHHKLDALLPRP